MALQPAWRVSTSGWPLSQASSTLSSWDEIIVGGKDGLFIVIMTLSWWIAERDGCEDESEGDDLLLEEAMQDVHWVLSNLVSVLAAGDHELLTSSHPIGRRSSPSTRDQSPSPSSNFCSDLPRRPKRQSEYPVKTGPPKKRRR